jgi:hypothetical protein
MSISTILKTIIGSALAGMVMGGLFGFASGSMTPDFFGHLIPWQDVKPIGFATFLGATVGVVLGGGMGCFAILVHVALHWRKTDK